MRKNKKPILELFLIILFIFIYSYYLYIYDIESILASLGINEPLYFIFFLALVAGTSSLTSTSLYISISFLVIAGNNFFLLGIAAGIGLFVGDTLYYYIGRKFGEYDEIKKSKYYKYLYNYVSKMGKNSIKIFVFLYSSFAPLPNDILMLILGSLRVKFWIFAIYLLLGNIFYISLIGLLSIYFLT
jgi:membrane protein YqaA with SNARE-associated domain